MAHNHTHAYPDNERSLFIAIVINLALTAVQVVGGLVSGSLSLLADALHNFSDAGALIIAYAAQKISGLPADKDMTYGYGRAQILGALINSVTLVIVGLYLIYEAVTRLNSPESIDGWIVIWVATVALVVDVATALLTHSGSKDSINMRAAFIHNLSDAMASVVVIVSGILILNFDVYWVDPIATFVISIYILYHSTGLIKSSVKTLMQAVPEGINREEVVFELLKLEGVLDIHHSHIWELNEKFRTFEAHIKIHPSHESGLQIIKQSIKEKLKDVYEINHSTLEIEIGEDDCADLDDNNKNHSCD